MEEASESVANDFLSQIHARLSQASSFPLSGAPRPSLAPHLRMIACGNYAIYYVPRVDEIVIVRVLHGSRDLVSIAEEGGFEGSPAGTGT